MEFLIYLFQCLYFMVPAYLANMAPVMTKDTFHELKVPIDMNQKLDKHRLFGKNKTFRGLIFGVIFGIIAAYIQYLLLGVEFFANNSLADYSNWLIIGFLMGLGAILGDLVESFFKRRFNIKPGKPFLPWDQTDFVIGALVLIYPLVILPIDKVIVILVASFFLHITTNHIAFYLKIRKEKW